MATSMTDLQVLQRGGRHEPTGVVIHPPARRWKTRVLLPAGIILAVLLLLGYAARESLLPARSVQVIPVVLREASADASAVSLGSVQAPGWVEADPFSVGASALADGVIREVLVLDGQAVQAGQTIARLIE